MFTANTSKNAKGYCQSNKNSICYDVTLHTDPEDHFHHPQILKLASETHTEWIFNPDKKHLDLYQNIAKKMLQCQNIRFQMNSRFTPNRNIRLIIFYSKMKLKKATTYPKRTISNYRKTYTITMDILLLPYIDQN